MKPFGPWSISNVFDMLYIIRIFVSFAIIGNMELARVREAKKKARTGKWYGMVFCSFFISFLVFFLSFSCLFLFLFSSVTPFYLLCLPFSSVYHSSIKLLCIHYCFTLDKLNKLSFPQIQSMSIIPENGKSNCWIDNSFIEYHYPSVKYMWLQPSTSPWYCPYIFGDNVEKTWMNLITALILAA